MTGLQSPQRIAWAPGGPHQAVAVPETLRSSITSCCDVGPAACFLRPPIFSRYLTAGKPPPWGSRALWGFFLCPI